MEDKTDIMVDALALASPSGRMSKRARRAAEKRLHDRAFGPGGIQKVRPIQPSEATRLLRQAATLRALADRGMCPRKYRKEADRLEAIAKALRPPKSFSKKPHLSA